MAHGTRVTTTIQLASPPVTEVVTDGTGAGAVPGAVAAVASGIDRGLHLGAQLYVSIDGKVVADLGIGHARAGVPMTPESMVVWLSMTKPSVAVAVAQQWERGNLELDDRVADHLPEFATTARTPSPCGISSPTPPASAAPTPSAAPRPATRTGTRSSPGSARRSPNRTGLPGQRAGYHLSCGMTLLAEIVRRCDGRRFEEYVRAEVFGPLGMTDCWVGMPAERAAGYGERIGTMHATAAGAAGAARRLRPRRFPRALRPRWRWARADAPAGAPVRGAAGAR